MSISSISFVRQPDRSPDASVVRYPRVLNRRVQALLRFSSGDSTTTSSRRVSAMNIYLLFLVSLELRDYNGNVLSEHKRRKIIFQFNEVSRSKRMALSIHYFFRIILIWLFCLLSVLLHELGHALGYRISGGKAGWKVIVGSGPRLISISRFTFGLIPAGGNFVPAEEPKTDKGQIIMFAGGPFVSLLQAVLYWIIYFCIFRFVQPESSLCEILLPVSSFLLYFNFFQFLFTAIPMRYKVICRGFESDGLQIIHILKHNKAS